MQDDIIRAMIPPIAALRYGLFLASLFSMITLIGVGFLGMILLYVYWIIVIINTLLITLILVGMIPPKTKEQTLIEKQMLYQYISEIPILAFFENNIYISKLISPMTFIFIIYALYVTTLIALMNNLLFVIGVYLITQITLKYLEKK